MIFLVRVENFKIPPEQLMFSRAFVGWILLLPYIFRKMSTAFSPRARFLWIRSIAGALAIACLFHNIQNSSAGDASALGNLAPLFVVLFSALFFRYRPSALEWLACITAILGALTLQIPSTNAISSSTLAIGLSGALFGGISYLSLKKAANKYSPQLVVWMLSSGTIVVSLLISRAPWIMPSATALGILLLIGVLGMIGQILMTWSYTYLPAPVAAPLVLGSTAWSVLLETFFLGRPLSVTAVAGYLMIGISICVLQKSKEGKLTKDKFFRPEPESTSVA